ncbi:Hpt domain-containing protein [Paracoccus luteus]|uniref:Hpt domain-containing protein n=1 Tax=Paracoccus luteus TaxID=2508543 RepID=UPI0014305F7A|nr:Hpt domain-containing protein [Paracoccus luteus]
MHRELGEPEFRTILELFLDEIEAAVRRPAAAGTAEFEAQLHFLKGSAWNIGLSDFGALCQVCEALAIRGCADQVDPATLAECYALSRQVLMRDLDRMLARGRDAVA